MEYQWFEELPPSCPPFDSVECDGLISVYPMEILRNQRTFSLKNDWHQIKFLKEKVLMIV